MNYAEIQDGVVIVTVKDTYNQKVAMNVERETNEFLDMGEKQFTFDFSNLEYMDSTGLGKLIELKEKLKEINGELVIKNLYGYCLELFKMNMLDKEFILQNEGSVS
jgi:anti-sigma B factor antagonist